jgi:hemerythrin superfamily protein
MNNTFEFLKKVNQNLVSKLDILNFIDEVTENKLPKLTQLSKDLETFEVNFISSEVVEQWFNEKVYNPKSISESYNLLKKIVTSKIRNFKTEPQKKEKVPVIALLHYYNGLHITRDNAQSIANKYGYNAKTSGEGLYHDFIFYAGSTNRKASGGNRLKCNNRIKNQRRVIELLTDETVKEKAITELKILETKLMSFN